MSLWVLCGLFVWRLRVELEGEGGGEGGVVGGVGNNRIVFFCVCVRKKVQDCLCGGLDFHNPITTEVKYRKARSTYTCAFLKGEGGARLGQGMGGRVGFGGWEVAEYELAELQN